MSDDVYREVGARLKSIREAARVTETQVEASLGIGPGWISRFERAEPLPDTYTLLAICSVLNTDAAKVFDRLNTAGAPVAIRRYFRSEKAGADVMVGFPYGKYDATYRLPNATVAELDRVLVTLRKGLAGTSAPPALLNPDAEAPPEVVAAMSDAVADAFLLAVRQWPDVNPSDLWYFVVYRAYLDVYNHPATNARLNLDQSWKRTGGWALERVLVRHYREFLEANGVELVILAREEKAPMLAKLKLPERVEADKLDVALLGGKGRELFGVVHVKASFAERRTDDVPMSQTLVRARYFSPLWTMDCKATPAIVPANRGELGSATGAKNAKRKDIEDDGYFSGCFSYNLNTHPTAVRTGPGFVTVCTFKDADDPFADAAIQAWKARRA